MADFHKSKLHLMVDLGMSGVSVSYFSTEFEEYRQPTFLREWPRVTNDLKHQIKLPASTSLLHTGVKLHGFESIYNESPEKKQSRGFKLKLYMNPEQDHAEYREFLHYVFDQSINILAFRTRIQPFETRTTIYITAPDTWEQKHIDSQYELVRSVCEGVWPRDSKSWPPTVTMCSSEGLCSTLACVETGKYQSTFLMDIGGLTVDVMAVEAWDIHSARSYSTMASRPEPLGLHSIDESLAKILKKKIPESQEQEPIVHKIVHGKIWMDLKKTYSMNHPTKEEYLVSSEPFEVNILEGELKEIFREYLENLKKVFKGYAHRIKFDAVQDNPLSAVLLTGGGAEYSII